MNTLLTDAVLLRSLVVFLTTGSIVGLLSGALLMWRPELMANLSKFANRWVSTRQMGKQIEKTISVDNWFYKFGHYTGAALMLGGLYIVYVFLTHFGRADILASLAKMHLVQAVWLEPLLDTLVLACLGGAVLALLVGLFLILRPSLLRDLEQGANQRISMRQTLKPLEMQHSSVDKLVLGHVQIAGVLLLAASLYTLVILLLWLLK